MKQFTFNSIPNCICVYRIFNTIDLKSYIGSTTSLNKRIVQHRYNYQNRKNNCPKLYNAISSLGSENFIVEILEEFSKISIIELHNKELEYITKYNSIENGYNERIDINGQNIVNNNIRVKMSNSGKNFWKNGGHKNHIELLSKFTYTLQDCDLNILEKNVNIKILEDNYGLHSSNIFIAIKKKCIKEYEYYDEKKTITIKTKNYYVTREFLKNTTRDKTSMDKAIKTIDNKSIVLSF